MRCTLVRLGEHVKDSGFSLKCLHARLARLSKIVCNLHISPGERGVFINQKSHWLAVIRLIRECLRLYILMKLYHSHHFQIIIRKSSANSLWTSEIFRMDRDLILRNWQRLSEWKHMNQCIDPMINLDPNHRFSLPG